MNSQCIGCGLCFLGIIAMIVVIVLDERMPGVVSAGQQLAMFCLGIILIGSGLAVAVLGD